MANEDRKQNLSSNHKNKLEFREKRIELHLLPLVICLLFNHLLLNPTVPSLILWKMLFYKERESQLKLFSFTQQLQLLPGHKW